MPERPLLIVVSAPSGAGKTTLCDRLLAACPDISYSVSCTTRPPRGNEKDGVDYRFLDAAEFLRRVEEGRFLEHARVHGHYYGTLRETVESELDRGQSVLMDLDVQGAASIRERVRSGRGGERLKAAFTDIFIEPPSMEALRERLERRGEDTPEAIARRIENARGEMSRRGEFRHRVVNHDLDAAYAELFRIVRSEMAATPA